MNQPDKKEIKDWCKRNFAFIQKKADGYTNKLGIKKVKVTSGKWTGYRFSGRKLFFSDEYVNLLNDRQIDIVIAHEIGHAYIGLSFQEFFNGRCYFQEMRADRICKELTDVTLDEWRELICFTLSNFHGARLHPLEYSIRKQAFM